MSTRREFLSWAAAGMGCAMTSAELFGQSGGERAKQSGASVEARRAQLYELLGDLPERNRPVSARTIAEEARDGYVLETLELDLNGIENVPAYFAKPKNVTGRVPTVVFNHSHGGGYKVGKKEFVDGRSYLQPMPYAEALTREGWAGLCIDSWVFGERAHTSEADTFKAMLWKGQVLWGMMVYDSIKAVDYLSTRDDVDMQRLGTLGISMGSTMAWWLAALDARIKVTVDICCLTDFDELLKVKGQRYHGVYYYVPSLLKHFTTAQINALIAPRPHLALAGLKDVLTPVAGLERIDAELKKVYTAHGKPENWQLLTYDVGHQETAAGRVAILEFLRRQL